MIFYAAANQCALDLPYLSQIKPFLQTVLLATVNAGSEEEKTYFRTSDKDGKGMVEIL